MCSNTLDRFKPNMPLDLRYKNTTVQAQNACILLQYGNTDVNHRIAL